MQLLNTLYVTLPDSYLRLDNDTLRIQVGDETKLRVPLHHLQAVVCFGHVNLSAPLMHRLAEEAIALVLLDTNGRFKARLEGAVSGNVLLRQAQHRAVDSASFTLEAARAVVAGKLKNQRQVLLRGAREAKAADEEELLTRAAQDLAASVRALPQATALDVLRGVEGEAARTYFAAINLIVRPDLRGDFSMDGRSRRPPRDRMNALLSFLYAMWMNDCRSACEAAGLEDRLALTLVNRGQLRAGDFELRDGGAVNLVADARKAVVVAYQERKQELLTHPLLADSLPLGVVPLVQARLLARHVRGETPGYLPFAVK